MDTPSRRHPHVVNISEVDAYTVDKGSRFHATGRRLGAAAGSRALGCSHLVVPPHTTAFPFHMHCATDEALYIIAGSGTLRIGEARVPVRAGDFIAHPAGTEAHQLLNDSDLPLEYLAMSTVRAADVVVYPDSNKIGAVGTKAGEGGGRQIIVRELVKRGGPPVDYYDGEDIG
ncbi:MAG: cupin domain-containing protein [Myxococcota bacterium]